MLIFAPLLASLLCAHSPDAGGVQGQPPPEDDAPLIPM